jgi:hypothetical protein
MGANLIIGLKLNGTELRLVGSAHPTLYQGFRRFQKAYREAIGKQYRDLPSFSPHPQSLIPKHKQRPINGLSTGDCVGFSFGGNG